MREDRRRMSGAWRVRSGVTQRGAGQIQPGDRLLLLLLLSPRSFIPPARGVGAKLQVKHRAASGLAFQHKSTSVKFG